MSKRERAQYVTRLPRLAIPRDPPVASPEYALCTLRIQLAFFEDSKTKAKHIFSPLSPQHKPDNCSDWPLTIESSLHTLLAAPQGATLPFSTIEVEGNDKHNTTRIRDYV